MSLFISYYVLLFSAFRRPRGRSAAVWAAGRPRAVTPNLPTKIIPTKIA